jgi:GntR family transcriptional regulator
MTCALPYTARMKKPAIVSGLQRLPPDGTGPLYRQAKRELQRLVECGGYAPGRALPSEAVIAEGLGVSIGTLRKAVDELVHEHVLVRRQGKGTFVALHTSERFLFQFFHVEARPDPTQQEAVPARDYPQVDCVGFARGRADEAEAAALRLRLGEPVLRIDNRLALAGRPVVHDHLVVSANMFAGMSAPRFTNRPGTIYSLYQAEWGITVLRAHERVRAAAAQGDTARILGVAMGLPVLEVHRTALTFGDRPVEYRVSTINTSTHDYVSVLAQRP